MSSDRREFLRKATVVTAGLGARRALDAGSDYLICQGTEAGGHVQSTKALYEVLPAVIDEAKTVPVVAAGGSANGAHIRRALLAGASGVLIGTPFVATREAGAHTDSAGVLRRADAVQCCDYGDNDFPDRTWP